MDLSIASVDSTFGGTQAVQVLRGELSLNHRLVCRSQPN
jgi:hypothetical protein